MLFSSIKSNKTLMKMNDYKTFPPETLFLKVLKAAPKEAFIYLHLWKEQNENGFFSIKKENVRKYLQVTPTVFRNAITCLDLFGFLCVEEVQEDAFLVYLYGYHERDI